MSPTIENRDNPSDNDIFTHSDRLSILARADGLAIKQLSETLIDDLGDIEVIQSRTGLVMVPMRDSVKGSEFHLGEVLVAEAHIQLKQLNSIGYGMIVGRDLEQAMAMAVIDAAFNANIQSNEISSFLKTAFELQSQEDHQRLCEVNATRVEMETF